MAFFAGGPNFIRAARWTGSNEAHIQAEIGAHVTDALTFHDNGSLSITGGYLGENVEVPEGWWIVSVAGGIVQLQDNDSFLQQYPTHLVGEPPFRFVVKSADGQVSE